MQGKHLQENMRVAAIVKLRLRAQFARDERVRRTDEVDARDRRIMAILAFIALSVSAYYFLGLGV